MLSVERPLRPRVKGPLAALAAVVWLAMSVLAAGADGLPEGFGVPVSVGPEETSVEAALPVVFVPFDLAAAERVQIQALIFAAAQRRGLDGAALVEIARCESQLNPRVTGPGGAAGLFQIIPSTWDWATARLGMTGASPIDPAANVEVAAWLMASFGPGQWPSC